MRLPVVDGNNADIDYPRLEEMISYAMDHNVNYFDTARYYHEGNSESALGRVLRNYPRNRYYLTDKLPYQIWSASEPAKEMRMVFQDQLKQCNTDYFDFYLFHSFQQNIYEASKQYRSYEYLKQMQAEGRIRKIGFSFHSSPEVLKPILEEFEWDAVQLQLNYYDWDFLRVKEMYSLCVQHNVPVFVMEPVRGGNLLNISDELAATIDSRYPNRSRAAWALRWVASLPNVLVVNSGMSSLQQLKENVDTLMVGFEPVSDEETQIVEAMKADIQRNTIVPCTGCRYCMDCPQGVDIPRVFSTLNDSLRVDIPFHAQINYGRFIPDDNKAHHCVSCGMCTPKCPQHIDIPKELASASEKLWLPNLSK